MATCTRADRQNDGTAGREMMKRVTTIFFPFNKIPPRSDSKGKLGNRISCMVEFDQKAGVTDVHAPEKPKDLLGQVGHLLGVSKIMKRFGIGLLAAGMLAAASVLTSLPASARGGGGGMIWIPPMGGGMGGGFGGGMGRGMGGGWGNPGGAWHGNGVGNGGNWVGGPKRNWHGPGGNPVGGNNYHGGKPYNGKWNGNNNWHGKGWNNNWYRNGRWYGPRYRYRYPGYNYYYGGFWYPWPWWSNVWNLQIGENYGYWGGNNGYYNNGGYGSRHVAWCRGRYRSYNVYTNTFTGYDGLQHRCNSPYD